MTLLLLCAALIVACGGGGGAAPVGESEAPAGAAPAESAAAAAGPPALVAWEDPEPPDAQARAEAVVGAEWNRDKITRLAGGSTTRLRMPITTLVDHTTGIAGFATRLAAETATVDERLARLGAEVTETEVTIRLPGSVLFDFDSAAIRPDAVPTLRELLGLLEAWPERPVRIEGHTDSIASEEYNQTLSERRAEAVRAWLVAEAVDAARLTTVGWGESRPVADNATAAGRQLNRRVEVVIGSV